VHALGAIIPWRALLGSGLGAVALHLALSTWSPPGWWVFAYGALLYGATVSLILLLGRNRKR
jgi:hypothetical protein